MHLRAAIRNRCSAEYKRSKHTFTAGGLSFALDKAFTNKDFEWCGLYLLAYHERLYGDSESYRLGAHMLHRYAENEFIRSIKEAAADGRPAVGFAASFLGSCFPGPRGLHGWLQ